MQTLAILRLAKYVSEPQQGIEVTIKIAKDMKWCLTNKHMQKWGAKAPVYRPIKHRESEEIFDTWLLLTKCTQGEAQE